VTAVGVTCEQLAYLNDQCGIRRSFSFPSQISRLSRSHLNAIPVSPTEGRILRIQVDDGTSCINLRDGKQVALTVSCGIQFAGPLQKF
jgi:hypothetical protein